MSYVWIAINLLSIALLLRVFLGVEIPLPHAVNKFYTTVGSLLIAYLNYLYLVPNGRFERIQREFEDVAEPRRRLDKILTLTYFYSTILLAVFAGIVSW